MKSTYVELSAGAHCIHIAFILVFSCHYHYTMARNEQKAQSMLSRFLNLSRAKEKDDKEGTISIKKKPSDPKEVKDLRIAEKWRALAIKELSSKVQTLQHAEGMPEHRIRELNDDANKLLREKRSWENRILELGGPNYSVC